MSSSSGSSSVNTPLFSNSPASTRMSSLTSSTHENPDSPPLPYASANLDNHSNISPVLASRICTSVLEHVLYLNGQIPFPVQGLPSLKLAGKTHAKAAKKRDELLASLDVLSSHLPSTFQSLSWALATNPQHLQATSLSATAAVDMVLVTGPSPTTVRSRCFIRLEDFPVSRYGERQSASFSASAAVNTKPDPTHGRRSPAPVQSGSPVVANPVPPPPEVEENKEEEEHDPEADASFVSFISDMSSALSSVAEEEHSEDEESEEEEEGEDAEETDGSSSQESEVSEEEEDSEEDYDEEDNEESSVHEDDPAAPLDSSPSASALPTHTNLAPTASAQLPVPSPSEDEKNLRASVRAVSLALASTFDFARDDIPLTQMNILLRAPRCFQHPSWLPKQALGRTLDGRLEEFFSGACAPKQGVRKGPPEEGVLVRCSSAVQEADGLQVNLTAEVELEKDEGQHDMIWWQWSAGVIRGFGDI